MFRSSVATLILPVYLSLADPASVTLDQSWERHAIDDSSRGADGVKLGHLNNDGLIDLTVGWEEGGTTRIYLHPGLDSVREKWPATTIGKTLSAEDATFVDLNGDSRLDVVSSCEGSEQTLYLHFAPAKGDLLDSESWSQFALPGSVGMTRWMFTTPANIELGDRSVPVLISGSKDPNGTIGYWEIPNNADEPSTKWNWRPLSKAGWIMSIIPNDMDGDGDTDIFFTDRKGENRGAHWLENPGKRTLSWAKHLIGGDNEELLFSNFYDLDSDGLEDLVATAKDRRLLWWRRLDSSGLSWELREVDYPENTARAKAVAIGDLDQDGLPDLVANCESAIPPLQGVFWLRQSADREFEEWESFGISGPEGIKFDRIELLDIDYDGDLDVLTCEEHHKVGEKRVGLGVIWYENPL